jgi:peptidoglycan biosynthesis protein MviN/MurJ (putative lipid II flippase)
MSLLLVKPLGLVGVALGTVAGMTFRTFHTVWYLSKHILYRPIYIFLLKLICNLGLGCILIYGIPHIFDLTASTIPELFVCAIMVSAVVFPVFFILNVLISYKSLLTGKKLFFKK